MDYKVFLALALLLGNAPLTRGGVFEHIAGGGAGRAHGVVEVANGARSIGVLRSIFHVARRLDDLDPAPVRLQLVRDNHGKTGAAACSHLGPVGDDLDVPIRLNAEIDT